MDRHERIIAYYITPHGFGHAVRSLEVIRQLLALDPDLRLILVSDLPEFLVEENAGTALPQRRRRLDIGLVQRDSIRFDLNATREALDLLYKSHELLVREEIEFLCSHRVQGIVSDVGFLPFHAASRLGIPAIGLGNFTWDWIYRAYAGTDPGWDHLIEWIREGYRKCDIFLQLPMNGDCSVCPNIIQMPLVARKAVRKPEETRRILGLDPAEKAYLISFAYLNLDPEVQRRLESIHGVAFYYKRPLSFDFANGYSLDHLDLSYPDVVAAVDGVITKPGYGIVSDCLAHGTPIIHTDRGFFAECEILVREMEQHLTTIYMPPEEFFAGSWEPSIRKLESLPRCFTVLRNDGASVCARTILDHLAEDRLIVAGVGKGKNGRAGF